MFEINYTLLLLTPLKIGTGISVAGFLDNTVTRNGSGKLVVPGSTIKGKTRASFYRLAEQLGENLHSRGSEPSGCIADQAPCTVCRIFGAPHWEGSIHFEPAELHPDLQALLDRLDEDRLNDNRSPLASLEYGRQVRTSVSLDRRQRTSLPDHLFSLEAVDPRIVFYGRISAPQTSKVSNFETALLCASLGFITHLGGGRGRGLGRCEFQITQVIKDHREMTIEEQKVALSEGNGVQA
jgi:CRISPR/Cas system CSM-associated protein Csm3 (group 7 of RAMP superfamily)